MSIFENKKYILIGDRDGIPGESIKAVVETIAGSEIIFATTECFVWTAAGAMDLENQKRIKQLTEEYGAENIIVVFGAAEGELTGLAAETCTIGDPTYAGCLTGVSLGLGVYHVVEPTFKEACLPEVFEEQIGMMEMILDVEDITNEITAIRNEHSKYNK